MAQLLFDKYRIKQLYIYAIMVTLFVGMYGVTISAICYEMAAQDLFKSCEMLYSFTPYSELFHNEQQQEELMFFLEESHVQYDTGIVESQNITDEDGNAYFLLSSMWYSYLDLKLAKGTSFTDNSNEVLVIRNYSNYEVGDIIKITHNENGINNTYELQVVGILDMPIFLDETWNYGISSGESFNGGTCLGMVKQYEDVYSGDAFLIHPQHLLVEKEMPNKISYIVFNEESTDSKEVLSLLSKHGDVEHVEVLRKTKISFWDRDEVILDIFLLLAFVCGILIHNYLEMKKRKREYGLYFMMGASWNQVIMISVCSNLLAFLVGVILGSIGTYAIYKSDMSGEMVFSWNNQLLIGIGMCVAYIISMVPVYISMKRTNPISLIRGTE